MKNAFKVEVSVRYIIPEATLDDGWAIIHRILHRSKGGKVSDLIFGLRSHAVKILTLSDFYIVYKKNKKTLYPLLMNGAQLSQGY